MRKIRRIVIFGLCLFTLLILYNPHSARADTLVQRSTYVSDAGNGGYGSGSGGSNAVGGSWATLGGYYGYYWASARYVDLGTAFTGDGWQTITVDVGLNSADVNVYYSSDNSNWTYMGAVSYHNDGYSTMKSFTADVNYVSGKTFRYFKAEFTSRVNSNSAVDDLIVTVNGPRPPITHVSTWVEQAPYQAGDGRYWVKPNTRYRVVSGTQTADSDYVPQGLYFQATNDAVNYEYGKYNVNVWNAMHWDSGQGWFNSSSPLQGGGAWYSGRSYYAYMDSSIPEDWDIRYRSLGCHYSAFYYEQNSWGPTVSISSDGRAPTISSAWIDGIGTSGYSVHIRGVSDNGRSGVAYVKIPTWTDNNGQDDITWYTVTPDSNGNIDYWIPISDHNNEAGLYHTHIYTYDNVGNSNCVYTNDNIHVIPRAINNSTWIQGDEYRDGNGKIWVQQGNTFTIGINGYTNYYDDNNKINSAYATIRDSSWNQTYFNATLGNGQGEAWSGNTQRNDLGMPLTGYYISRNYNWITSYWDTAINQDNKTIYINPLFRIYDGNHIGDDNWLYSSSQWWQDGTGASVTSDGRAPTISDAYIENVTPFGYDVVVEGIDDNGGSGVDNVQLPTWTDTNGQDDIKWYKVNTSGGTITYHININNHNNENGVEYNTHIYTYDKVGNSACAKTLRVMVPSPYPVNSALRMEQYNFQQYSDLNGNDQKDSNEPLQPIYWVKPTTSNETTQFKVYTEGYFPSSYGIDPTRTYVLFAKNGNLNMSTSARQYAEEYGVYKYGSEFDSCFNFTGEDYAQITEKDSKKYISATHVLEAKNHGDKFKLYYTNSYMFNGTEYYSGYIDSGIQVKVDGKPPDGSGSVVVNYENLDMDITASGVSDPDSGINGVWALIYQGEKSEESLDDIDSATTDGFIRKRLTKVANGSYSLHMNAYNDAFKSEKITVAICAKDNVGNKTILNNYVEDLFTLKARVVPLNNKGYNSPNPPVLEEGQAGVLIMETTGEAESLDIKYEELDDLDESLKRDTITIYPKKLKDRKEDNFIVPLYAPNKTYKVTVIAHRGDSTREAYPEFIVSDSVLHGIKTKIKN